MENTATRLNKIMAERGLRQVDILRLAEPYCKKYNIKLNKSDLSQFVSGKVEPGQWKLTILGLALSVSEAWLMGYDVSMERGGFGALDPVLPQNMQGANLDGAKIDADFLRYMLSNLSSINKNTAQYIRTRNNILAIAESSGLSKLAIEFINRLEDDMAERGNFPSCVEESIIENPDIRMIARAGKKMTPEQAENLRKYAQYMFPEAFKDDDT